MPENLIDAVERSGFPVELWPRVRAALEAAREMEECLDVIATAMGEEFGKSKAARAKFRRAMWGR